MKPPPARNPPLSSHISRSGRQWFSEDTFLALLRLRGVAANAPSRYAEGFYLRKGVF